MWHFETWSCGGLGSAELMAGLDDLTGPFQPKQFHGSKMQTLYTVQ